MGAVASRSGSAASRAARAVAKESKNGGVPPASVTQSHLPKEDDVLANFKPTKGESYRGGNTLYLEPGPIYASMEHARAVVEISRPEAQEAAKRTYDRRVPEMDLDVLQKFKELGPAMKAELAHQKLTPDASQLKPARSSRPLPRNRSKVVAPAEFEVEKGWLTQTQLLSLLRVQEGNSAERSRNLAEEYGITEEDARILLRYCRTPDVRKVAQGELVAKWSWKGDDDTFRAAAQR